MDNRGKIKLRIRMILVFLVVVFLGVAIGMLFTPAFNVQEVWCEGNERIPQEDIIETAQIVIGKNILLQSVSNIRKRIEKIPMVETVSVKRVIPDKFRIIIKERVPAAYMYFGDGLAVIDTEGRVLDILSDERVDEIVDLYTPESVKQEENSEETEASQKENTENTDGENSEENKDEQTSSEEATEDEADNGNQRVDDRDGQENSGENSEEQSSDIQEAADSSLYAAPLVVGVDLDKPEAGKTAGSKEKEKFSIALDLFYNLGKAGLLSRATYIDLSDISDIMLVIENRLEIQIGSPDNLEYRCVFLAKVINEKISSTEHVLMDYRTDDIYVRQPDYGQARMQPTAAPKPSQAPNASSKPSSDSSESNVDLDNE